LLRVMLTLWHTKIYTNYSLEEKKVINVSYIEMYIRLEVYHIVVIMH